jgi:hypothetical protein
VQPFGGGGCNDNELIAATADGATYDDFTKCYFVFWTAPNGFPAALDQFQGPAAVIQVPRGVDARHSWPFVTFATLNQY